MSERTIFIRNRPAGFHVVVKPPANVNRFDFLPDQHADAATYAKELHEANGWPVVDETDGQPFE
jgi:hypothetical protein